ncbi:UNVERIFIED_CONTAM: hypothetical protein FKN15_023198 [Acipenser sinensis]
MEFRRRRGFPVTQVTGVLSILMLGVCSVSASEFVKVPSSVNCTVGQDCILNMYVYINNRDQLEDLLPQYVNRTSLSDCELQHGDASLLLRRVTEKDAGKYRCEVYAKQSGWCLIELVLVPAEPTTPPVPAESAAPAVLEGQHHWFIVVPVVLGVIAICVGLVLCKKHAACCWKSNNALTASYSLT